MNVELAAAVAGTVPILALAAGVEARSIRERLQASDPAWERKFADYNAEKNLDLDDSPTEIIEYFKGMPGLSWIYTMSRILHLISAIVWLVVFGLLTASEIMSLDWLANDNHASQPWMAHFLIWSVGAAMVALIAAPAAYFLAPVLLPFDVMPAGLRQALVSAVAARRESQGSLKGVVSRIEAVADKLDELEAQEARESVKTRKRRGFKDIVTRLAQEASATSEVSGAKGGDGPSA